MAPIPSVQTAFATCKDPQANGAKKLGIHLKNGKTVGNGEHVSRHDATEAPKLSIDNPSGEYVGVCLDLDAPFPSFPVLGPILHWIQPHMKAEGTMLKADVPPVAEYIGPGPPPLSGPHNYLFLLYEQPAGFDAKKLGQQEAGKAFPTTKRIRYNYDTFLQDSKVGKIVAADWFVSN